MTVLIIYMMLMRSGAFEVVSIERNREPDYCQYLADDLDKAWDARVGNVVVVCTPDRSTES